MELYTTSEAGRLLNLSPETISRYIKSGKLKGFKKGKTWLILPSDLEELTKSEWFQIERSLKVGRPKKIRS